MSMQVRQRSNPLQKFTSGLNNYWDASSIKDDELSSVINFEFSTSGSLMSRPPIWAEKKTTSPYATVVTPATDEPLDIIGTYIRLNGDRYLVGITNDKTWIYNVITQAWTQVAAFRASDCTQYMDKLVLCSTTTAGGYWNGTTFTVTNMPELGGIELMQNRFFGYGVEGTDTANTIFWSDITTSGPSGEITSVWDWDDTDSQNYYVDIGNGDGQWITAMAPGYNDLVIFRNKSTYRYSFNEDPALGTMQSQQQDIGAENKQCVVKFDNSYYVLSGQTLYKYQNWLFYPLNAQRIKFESDSSAEYRFQHAVSIVGRRCIVFHNGSTYALNLDTQTWSEWSIDSEVAYFVTVPRQAEDLGEELYYGISAKVDQPIAGIDYPLFRTSISNSVSLSPTIYGTTVENIKCFIRTKTYDFNTPVEWKRLYFWAADITTSKAVKATVVPVALEEVLPTPTWDELSKDYDSEPGFKTWDELSYSGPGDPEYGTWDLLISSDGGFETTIAELPNYGRPQRIEAKLNQSLRFRRIYFELYLECDGSPATSPVQVYSITPMIGVKAKVARGAN
jgi:hypothetical protein